MCKQYVSTCVSPHEQLSDDEGGGGGSSLDTRANQRGEEGREHSIGMVRYVLSQCLVAYYFELRHILKRQIVQEGAQWKNVQSPMGARRKFTNGAERVHTHRHDDRRGAPYREARKPNKSATVFRVAVRQVP